MSSSSDNFSPIRFFTTATSGAASDISASRHRSHSGAIGYSTLIFTGILIAYACYIALFIWDSSFIVDGERYFCLFDDAMISMRFAKNLAQGNGMVWNPGQYIEGITNPLWTVIMALFHLLPIAPSKMSLPVQILSGLLLIANLFFVRRIADALSGGSPVVMAIAVVFTAFYLPLNTWSLLGMEVGLLTLLTTAAAWTAIDAGRNNRFSPWPYLLLGFGTLVRMDMTVPFLMLLAFNLLHDREHRRRHIQVAIPLLGTLLLGQSVARWFYYGNVLPNTYYLKMTGYPIFWRIMRGIMMLLKFAWQMNWIIFLLPFIAALVWRSRLALLLLTLVIGQILYSVYVGGDAWETWGGANRYLCIAMPSFFVLLAFGIRQLYDRVHQRLAPAGRVQSAVRIGAVVVIVAAFANVNAIYTFYALPQLLLINRPLTWAENRNGVRWAQIVERFTKPGATIAVAGAGVSPYFFDRPAIDELGKCDTVIAHQQMHRTTTGWKRFTDFYPGHLKWDSRYSIGTLKPDAFIHMLHPEEVQDIMTRDYTKVMVHGLPIWLRNDSENINWDQVR